MLEQTKKSLFFVSLYRVLISRNLLNYIFFPTPVYENLLDFGTNKEGNICDVKCLVYHDWDKMRKVVILINFMYSILVRGGGHL